MEVWMDAQRGWSHDSGAKRSFPEAWPKDLEPLNKGLEALLRDLKVLSKGLAAFRAWRPRPQVQVVDKWTDGPTNGLLSKSKCDHGAQCVYANTKPATATLTCNQWKNLWSKGQF